MKPRFPSTALTLSVGTGRILTLDTGTFTRGTLNVQGAAGFRLVRVESESSRKKPPLHRMKAPDIDPHTINHRLRTPRNIIEYPGGSYAHELCMAS